MQNYQKLEARFRKINRLSDLARIAGWDEAVVMPEGASAYRNESLAELGLMIQELSSESQMGQWIEAAAREDLSEWQRANLREIKRIYIENTAIPPELNQRLTIARMNGEQQWRVLRAAWRGSCRCRWWTACRAPSGMRHRWWRSRRGSTGRAASRARQSSRTAGCRRVSNACWWGRRALECASRGAGRTGDRNPRRSKFVRCGRTLHWPIRAGAGECCRSGCPAR